MFTKALCSRYQRKKMCLPTKVNMKRGKCFFLIDSLNITLDLYGTLTGNKKRYLFGRSYDAFLVSNANKTVVTDDIGNIYLGYSIFDFDEYQIHIFAFRLAPCLYQECSKFNSLSIS